MITSLSPAALPLPAGGRGEVGQFLLLAACKRHAALDMDVETGNRVCLCDSAARLVLNSRRWVRLAYSDGGLIYALDHTGARVQAIVESCGTMMVAHPNAPRVQTLDSSNAGDALLGFEG